MRSVFLLLLCQQRLQFYTNGQGSVGRYPRDRANLLYIEQLEQVIDCCQRVPQNSAL
jgi:hypothetical protein